MLVGLGGITGLFVGWVLASVVLGAVDLDDDARAVRGQEEEVHALPVQRTGLFAAAARVAVVAEVDQRRQFGAVRPCVAGAVGAHSTSCVGCGVQ